MPLFDRYTDLLDHIHDKGHTPKTLGRTPDGQAIVAIKSGGDKSPAIFISAGSHSTEQAGVTAAVELIDELLTEPQVYVVPTRDPIGMMAMIAPSASVWERRYGLSQSRSWTPFCASAARYCGRRTTSFSPSSANTDSPTTACWGDWDRNMQRQWSR